MKKTDADGKNMPRLSSLVRKLVLSALVIYISEGYLLAQQERAEHIESEKVTTEQQSKKQRLDDIVVTEKKERENFVMTPSKTTINLESYKMPNTSQNLLDIIKNQAVIDFRGQSDLVPGYDTIYMKGFDSNRFTTAVDGMMIDAGGGGGTNVVNYGTLSLGQIDHIEIIPGPHSALYPGKSVGGVINMVTKKPERHTTTKPDVRLSTSYKSYNTQNHSIDVNGGKDSLYYGFSYQYYRTDGYLRNNDAEINSFAGKLGYVLPSDGHIGFSIDYSDILRGHPVKNDKSAVNYDPDYPECTTSYYKAWQKSNNDEEEYTLRLNYEQPHPYGTFTFSAYYRDQDITTNTWVEEGSTSPFSSYETQPDNIFLYSWLHIYEQAGGRIQDQLEIFDNHILTLGYQLDYTGRPEDTTSISEITKAHDTAIVNGVYLQDQWTILPRLDLRAGLRYEDATLWRTNVNWLTGERHITGEDDWIERNRSQLIPKSFLTYGLDDLADALRDTSVSVGISKIWNPFPFCYMCGRGNIPYQTWIQPEHGVGYDFILTRRLFRDIDFKIDYSYYIIKDYVASNRSYAKYTPTKNNSVQPGLEYSDMSINLDEMLYRGVEIGFNGYIWDDLSFYINYVYTDLNYDGDAPAGEEAEDERARHRVNAGFGYNLSDSTLFMLDYKYQSEQTEQVSEELSDDEYLWYTVDMDAYSLVDFAVEQRLFEKYGGFKDVTAKFYINNLLDEEYVNSKGYLMTDRTFGVSLSFVF